MRVKLGEVASRMGIDPDTLPKTDKTKLLTTKQEVWEELAPDDPLVAAWLDMQKRGKLLQFLLELDVESVHPRYHVLKRTGRTSATDPNIQQMPKEGGFRELFMPRPGHKLIVVDYSAIEMVTFAANCISRFGFSTIADKMKAGIDPHCYTAAMIKGWDYGEVKAAVAAEKAAVKDANARGLPAPPTPFSAARQAAKAVNFGVPGGLGADSLVAYAKSNYGVTLTREQA
ncbi:MAG TPA: DNA polymerase, partial [bacterium]|nr:DNA polymerase [bacterium]